MLGLVALVLVGAVADVQDVSHAGVIKGDVVEWQTSGRVYGPGEVRFIVPQAPGTVVEGGVAEAIVDEKGRFLGFRVEQVNGGLRFTVRAQQPGGHALVPPLLDVTAVQKIVVDGGPLQFAPAAETGLEQRVGRLATRSVRHHEIDALEVRGDLQKRPMYVRVSDGDFSRGIAGELVDTRVQKLWALGVACVMAVVIVMVLGVLYARLRRHADAERAEKIIHAEFGPL